jgi:hypothetical protein
MDTALRPTPPLAPPHTRPEYPLPGEGELQLWLRSYAPFKKFGGGYEGDDRGPSTDTRETSRIFYVFTFDYAKMAKVSVTALCDASSAAGFLPRLLAYTSPVARLDMQGRLHAKGHAHQTTTLEPLGRPGTGFAMCAQVSAAVPLVGVAAAIDIQLSVRITKTWNGSLSISGNIMGDGFPNCEVFIRDAAGDSVLLHSFRTRGDHAGPYVYLPGQNFRLMGGFGKLLQMNVIGLLGR